MDEILEKIRKTGIVPVVVISDPQKALPLAKALCDGGLPCAEVTFRTEAAQEAIRIMTDAFPEMLVGAGTIRSEKQVDLALEAGARFMVSPGLNPKVVHHCKKKGILITPGCSNAGDIEMALEHGLKVVKFFPAEPSGGLPMIRALAAPYPEVLFMPTGGLGPSNVGEYLSYDRILACGGSWMVKEDLIAKGDFDQIRKLAEEAVKIVRKSRKNQN